jgi:hypothetical protein|tara:strand:- start:2170 stop:2502 length:333 start_codon:yes stop_codon:yes gene_type:complete
MKILEIENDDMGSSNGTCLQGKTFTTYYDLVDKFGEPTFENGDKTTCEWVLTFKVQDDDSDDPDDWGYETATIYDWKEVETPMGQYGWNVGGNSYRAVELVDQAMEVEHA